VRIALMGFILGQHTWAYFVFYIVLFLIGYMFAVDDRFTDAIKRNGWVAFVLGIVSFAVQGLLVMILNYRMFREPFSVTFVIYEVVLCIGIWGLIVFLMSLAAKHWNKPSRTLAYANEAVLPFFLFHQTVILSIGWFVIPCDLHLIWKLIIVTAAAFAVTLGLYEVLVRRFNIVRFFFGMRPRRTGE